MPFCGSVTFKEKRIFTPNAKFAYAVEATSVRPATDEQLYIAQGSTPQSWTTSRPYVKEVIYPFLTQTKADIEARNFDKARQLEDATISVDTGFNSVRHAQACVTAVAIGVVGVFKLLFTIIKTDGPSAKMEGANMKRVFEIAIADQKIDVGKCSMDQNSSNRLVSKITLS